MWHVFLLSPVTSNLYFKCGILFKSHMTRTPDCRLEAMDTTHSIWTTLPLNCFCNFFHLCFTYSCVLPEIDFWQESSDSLSVSANTEFCKQSTTILARRVPPHKTFYTQLYCNPCYLFISALLVHESNGKKSWTEINYPLTSLSVGFRLHPPPTASSSLLINHYLPPVSPRAPPLPIPTENALHADTKVTFRQRQTNTVCNIYRYAYLTLPPSALYFPPLLPPPLLVPTPLEWRSYEDEWCLSASLPYSRLLP